MGIKAIRNYFNIPSDHLVHYQGETIVPIRDYDANKLFVGPMSDREMWSFSLNPLPAGEAPHISHYFSARRSDKNKPEFINRMIMEREKLLALWAEIDVYDNLITVYSSGFPDTLVKVSQCEVFGYPHVTTDGECMYENTHYLSEEKARSSSIHSVIGYLESLHGSVLKSKSSLIRDQELIRHFSSLLRDQSIINEATDDEANLLHKPIWVDEATAVDMCNRNFNLSKGKNAYDELHLLLNNRALFFRYDENDNIQFLLWPLESEVSRSRAIDLCKNIHFGSNGAKDDNLYLRLQQFSKALAIQPSGVSENLIQAICKEPSDSFLTHFVNFTAKLYNLKNYLRPYTPGEKLAEHAIVFPSVHGSSAGWYAFYASSMHQIQSNCASNHIDQQLKEAKITSLLSIGLSMKYTDSEPQEVDMKGTQPTLLWMKTGFIDRAKSYVSMDIVDQKSFESWVSSEPEWLQIVHSIGYVDTMSQPMNMAFNVEYEWLHSGHSLLSFVNHGLFGYFKGVHIYITLPAEQVLRMESLFEQFDLRSKKQMIHLHVS